jgi:hypothetical protein
MGTKQELFGVELKNYLSASKKKKSEILDSLKRQTKMHRKAIIRALSREQMRVTGDTKKRGRKEYYGADCTSALKDVWVALDEPCGELLHPCLRSTILQLKKDKNWDHSDVVTGKLCAMSESTIKRRVSNFTRLNHPNKGRSTTKPSSLKEKIPVFCGPWLEVPPGHGQIDTVVHCGSTLKGDIIWSTGYTDVALLWTEYRAQWNCGQEATRDSLEKIRVRLPFLWIHAHPDCGKEFLNGFVITWSEEHNIKLTRSRPYHKNDNGYIEQKNGHWVRAELGYGRLDAKEVLPVMNEFYEKLCLYRNHFKPQRKCIEKTKIGKKYIKKYDEAQTPFDRVLAHKDMPESVKKKLRNLHNKLNLLELKEEVATLKKKLFAIQRKYGTEIR